ncbi:type IV pilus assembly protein FimV [Undibacterium danionis]|uniref:type IV pilus assembly protein FimV n=1 Tax=Undibacterium danionis TaxID=1812100 RepID=UPI0036F2C262
MPAFGLGLGEIRVRSSLGQGLLAHADIVGSDTEVVNSSCLRARILTMDGVFVASANITVYQNQKKRALSFTTKQHINEPAINLVIDINCDTQLHREFSILLDPPELSANAINVQRDESPFAVAPTAQNKNLADGNDGTKLAAIPESEKAPKKSKKKRENLDAGIASPQPSFGVDKVPVPAASTAKPKKLAVAKDVLKLSDEVILPAQQGLRMSDVLSTESGKELIQNMEELRAAQAKMAAILRDEKATIDLPVAAKDGNEIANLKSQAEQLKKQNLLDKAALAQLQNKTGFDSWLIILAIVAIISILIILFLLLYIRKNLNNKMPTWWEDDSLASDHASAEKIDDVIKNFQTSFEPVGVSDDVSIVEHRNAASDAESDALDSFDDAGKTKITEPASLESARQRTPTLEETNSSIFNFFTPRGSSVKVEEISDVTQEAEFWISMNDPQRAIEILAAQEKVAQPDSPVPWLFLLDLYRTVKDAEKYKQLRERFISFFNANVPEYDADLSQVQERHLEDFPHLIQRISAAWNTPDIIPYLESLLIDDREGKRSGFDLPVYRDILMLLGIAHELDKIMAIEGPIKTSRTKVDLELSITPQADPVAEADFGTIEFEIIDFPKMENAKKSS